LAFPIISLITTTTVTLTLNTTTTTATSHYHTVTTPDSQQTIQHETNNKHYKQAKSEQSSISTALYQLHNMHCTSAVQTEVNIPYNNFQ